MLWADLHKGPCERERLCNLDGGLPGFKSVVVCYVLFPPFFQQHGRLRPSLRRCATMRHSKNERFNRRLTKNRLNEASARLRRYMCGFQAGGELLDAQRVPLIAPPSAAKERWLSRKAIVMQSFGERDECHK